MGKNVVKIAIVVFVMMFIISADSYIYANSINGVSFNNSINEETNEKEGDENTLLDIKEKQSQTIEDYKIKYGSDAEGKIAYWLNYIYIYLNVFHCLVWIICIIAIILNFLRKNIGKAIFSIIGFIIPFISLIITSLEKLSYTANRNAMSVVIFAIAVIVEIAFGILSFIFCFSKSSIKNKYENSNSKKC